MTKKLTLIPALQELARLKGSLPWAPKDVSVEFNGGTITYSPAISTVPNYECGDCEIETTDGATIPINDDTVEHVPSKVLSAVLLAIGIAIAEYEAETAASIKALESL